MHWFDWSTKWRKRFNHVTKCCNVTVQDQSSSFVVQILKEGTFKSYMTENMKYLNLYHYMKNYCNLIGLEQEYFSLI